MATRLEITEAEQILEGLKRDYLLRFGWTETCATPGSCWLWRRDFAAEDAASHARWKEAGPGPYGWQPEPRPYGIITAQTDLAVSMTERCLDDLGEEAEAAE